MKKSLLFLLSLFTGAAVTAQEDYTTVTIPLQAGYTNQVYYKFADNTQTAIPTNTWDLALLRNSTMATGIRINDARGIQVFEASSDVNDWAAINITEESNWTPLYNEETVWETGAFDNGSATYGWGEYNPATHHVTGSVIFVLKYTDNSYKKIIIEDYFGGYTLRYADWNDTEWGADETITVSNSQNYDNMFNYFSLESNTTVAVAPADENWDLVFGRYYGNIGSADEPTMYLVTGVLHNSETVSVAEMDETGNTETDPAAPSDELFTDEINTIGDDWKSFNMDTFTYDINPEKTYYVKHSDGNIYRMYFTSFEGTATGNLSFNYKNITAAAGLDEVNQSVSFGLYPNPATEKKVTLLYNLDNNAATKSTVAIYTVTGAKVFETQIADHPGFYGKELNLSHLTAGIYIVQMKAGSYQQSKKLVIK